MVEKKISQVWIITLQKKKEKDQGKNHVRKIDGLPMKVLWYLSFIPRLKCLFVIFNVILM